MPVVVAGNKLHLNRVLYPPFGYFLDDLFAHAISVVDQIAKNIDPFSGSAVDATREASKIRSQNAVWQTSAPDAEGFVFTPVKVCDEECTLARPVDRSLVKQLEPFAEKLIHTVIGTGYRFGRADT